MHERTNDAPFRSLVDALSKFPETATAIAVRLSPTRDGETEFLAPVGLEDLFALRVRPTRHFFGHPERYEERLTEKRWLATWPRLDVIHARSQASPPVGDDNDSDEA